MRDVPPDGVVILMKWLWEGIWRRWLRLRNFVYDLLLLVWRLATGIWDDRMK